MWTLREQRLQGLGNGPSMGDIEVAPVPPQPAVAVAIDRDKSSQNALKWAVDNLVTRGQTIMLVHVANRSPTSSAPGLTEDQAKELFLPFRCFCTRKDVRCKDIILEDSDVSKAIIDFVAQSAVEKLVMGYPSRNPFIRRFRGTDITTSVSKGAPDFCTVYVINKGKIASMRQAVRQAPAVLPFRPQVQQNSLRHEVGEEGSKLSPQVEAARPGQPPIEDNELIKSPFSRGMRGMAAKSYADLIIPETDASFVSSGRPSVDRLSASAYDHVDINPISRSSNASDGADQSFELVRAHLHGSMDVSMLGNGFSASSQDNGMASYSSPNIVSADQSGHWSYQNDVEAEMRRLRMELRQTMDLYSTACKEALTAKHMARQFQWWKMEEKQRLEEARLAEEAALAIAENEKAKCKAAMEAAEAAKRLAELEAQKRIDAEKKALKEKEEKQKALQALANNDLRCRKYTIQEIEAATDLFSEKRKIGEGGYGPVYKCYLDHTAVAIKVLRSDAAQGRSQFQQEVEVLSCIRHPNMVLLLGACPEYGYLVYEYMENGSLEDRLFRKDGTPALSWQLRFRIAAEIGTGLLFLHQTKPEPLVHRDLKPANILLDRNYVSKISDVGLARLVPPKVADDVTQYRMTSTAGTFCYIDPEYQQTGMLGIKSDVYSLGVILLQLITGRPPMGLTHYVSRAIEMGKFEEMLDPTVPDWTVEEALSFAKIALQCTELRRKDRPDLDTVVLPELNRLRALANESIHHSILGCTSPDNRSQTTISNVTMSAPATQCSYESLKSRSSVSYIKGTNIS